MKHLVFVYGSLKKGYGNHALINLFLRMGKAEDLGNFVTIDSNYEMISLGAFPAVMRGGRHRIAGEVYSVDDHCLEQLDSLEGNGHFYTRELQHFINEKGDMIEAWVYLIERRDRPIFYRSYDTEINSPCRLQNDTYVWTR